MEFIDKIRRNLGRIALTGTLSAVMITSLAACGGTVVGSPSQPSAGPTNPPGTDMSMAEPTQDPNNATGIATPTQATADGAADGGGTATQVSATLREWAIDLSQKEVPAGNVQFTVTNAGRMTHNF